MESDRPNIIFLVMDTARARNFSTYGYPAPTSPNLSRIAEKSTVYRNVIATAPWTIPSHASMFTGLYTSHHGTNRSSLTFPDSLGLLPELLGQRGYRTYAITANKFITNGGGFERGFDNSYITTRPFPNGSDYSSLKEAYAQDGISPTTARRVAEQIQSDGGVSDLGNLAYKFLTKQLRGRCDKSRFVNPKGSERNVRVLKDVVKDDESSPFFVYLNFMETHLKYLPPEPHRSEFVDDVDESELWDVNQDPRLYNYAKAVSMSDRDFELLDGLYNGAIKYTDEQIGEIYDFLDREGELEDTLFIVLGDHGENIGDQGLMGHSLALNDALLRVPLVVSYPGATEGKMIDGLVQTHDLFPTILGVSEIDVSSVPDPLGSDARPLPREQTDPCRDYAVAEYLGSPFAGIERIMEDYPSVDYDQYDYEIKTVYASDRTKLTLRSDGKRRLSSTDVTNGETSYQGDDTQGRSDELETVLFDRIEPFQSGHRDTEYSETAKSTLKDLGYI